MSCDNGSTRCARWAVDRQVRSMIDADCATPNLTLETQLTSNQSALSPANVGKVQEA